MPRFRGQFITPHYFWFEASVHRNCDQWFILSCLRSPIPASHLYYTTAQLVFRFRSIAAPVRVTPSNHSTGVGEGRKHTISRANLPDPTMDMTATKIQNKGMTRKVSECWCGKAVACGVEARLRLAHRIVPQQPSKVQPSLVTFSRSTSNASPPHFESPQGLSLRDEFYRLQFYLSQLSHSKSPSLRWSSFYSAKTARAPQTTTDPSSFVAANAPYVPHTWVTPQIVTTDTVWPN